MKRSGVLSAPWVSVIDKALLYEYHADLKYLFPHDMEYISEEDIAAVQQAPVDRAAVATMLNRCPAAFHSAWYIAALTRVPAALLGTSALDVLVVGVRLQRLHRGDLVVV